MKYVDAIMIIDNKSRIVYSVRFNPRFDKDGCKDEFESIINRNFLEVYPSIKPEESTVMTCLKYGVPIYSENQIFRDEKGRVYNTQNLTLPIIRSGKILGAIELSKDITRIKEDIPIKVKKNPHQ